MKIATRSFMIGSDDPDQYRRIIQSIIECYQTAQRSMFIPMLRHVERRTQHQDMQLILTFDPVAITTRTKGDSVTMEFS